MSIVATLIDKARQRGNIASDSALATLFGVQRQAVSKWRNGDAYPDEDHIAEMAVMAGDDPAQWLVAIRAVRSEGTAGKYWAALAKRLAATAMTLALGVSFALPARAQDVVAGFKAPAEVYIMRNCVQGDTDPGALDLAMDQVLLAQALPSRNGTRSMSDSYNIDRRPPCWTEGWQGIVTNTARSSLTD